MSGIIARRALFWAIALVLALGVFVLLGTEARAAGPEIEVKGVLYDNGSADNHNRNAGHYTVNFEMITPGEYEANIVANDPLVAYRAAGGSNATAPWIDLMIKFTGESIDITQYHYRIDGFDPAPFSSGLTSDDTEAAEAAGADDDTSSFVWSIQSQADILMTTGRKIELKLGDSGDVTTLTVKFTPYTTDTNDPLYSYVWQNVDDAQTNDDQTSNPLSEIILDGIEGLGIDGFAALPNQAEAIASLERLQALYVRALIGEKGGDEVGTTIGDPSVFDRSKIKAVGATLYGRTDGAKLEKADLWFSAPAAAATLSGEAGGIAYETSGAFQFSFSAFRRFDDGPGDTEEIVSGDFNKPIVTTLPIPAGINANNAMLIYIDGGVEKAVALRNNGDGTVTFVMPGQGVFAFVNLPAAPAAASTPLLIPRAKEPSTPIVPVLYDVFKSGDTFTFKTIITNATGPMAGASVTIKLNDKYSTTVTIGQDGVGNGTITAPGFTGTIAAFHGRVNGLPHSVNQLMTIHSTGQVVRM